MNNFLPTPSARRRQLNSLAGAFLSLFTAFPMNAQFRTPIPAHLPDSVVKTDLLLKTLARLEREQASRSDPAAALCRDPVAMRVKASDALCRTIADSLRLWRTGDPRAQAGRAPSASRTVLSGKRPSGHDRSSLLHYLASADVDTEIGFMGDLFATASTASAYVASDIVGGLVGRTLFSMTYARVVVRDTVADTLTRALVASDAATMQRLLNNGGTVAARFVLPLYAAGGVTSQRAASVYPVIGFDGPLTAPDSLSLVVSGVFEYANSLAIRSLSASGAELGTLELTARVGLLRSERPLVSVAGAPRQAGFMQLGFGLRQNGKIGVSALYTRTTSKDILRAYYPRFLVSFSALKM